MSESKLGDFTFQKRSFKDLDSVFERFYREDFKKLGDRQRSDIVNQCLLDLIQKEPEPCFLFAEVLHFIERVDKENILHHYIFTSFELWLNQYSGLSFEENLLIRAKIVGKRIPREDYQALFPIGMGKIYPGTHFVTAHKSPDLDTTIASFWGWMDAFGAKVGDSLHIWNLPEGPPASQIEIDMIFRNVFGASVFTHLPKTRTILSLTGNDLMTQKDLIRRKTEDDTTELQHDRSQTAIVITDDDGYYLGDWRSMDVEGVRQVLMLMNQCLRWFENHLHLNLIELFSKKDLTHDDIPSFTDEMFGLKIRDCEPAREFNDLEKKRLDALLKEVLSVEKGIDASFQEYGEALTKLSIVDFTKVRGISELIKEEKLFDENGKLNEDRSLIFSTLGKIISGLHAGIQTVRSYMEKLEIALMVKKRVFGFTPKFVTVRADVEEIRSKMGSYQYLTVAYPDKEKFYPVGIIHAADLRKDMLGTVSLRDFCNRSEMTIPSYLEVISVIDHHKTELATYQPPMAIISDAQSSNAIVAKQAFLINDRHSVSGMRRSDVDQEIKKLLEKKGSVSSLKRLFQYKKIFDAKAPFFIHPEREMVEYFHFLYGILDDTDLLSKVSVEDVEITASLLNRLKSLMLQRETEIVSLDDIPKDADYPIKAAERILKNEDMYSLYKKVYTFREEEVERNMQSCASGQPSSIFSDTKEQNGLARVGQTKMFANNIAAFEKNKDVIRKFWYENAIKVHDERPEYDLHMHMISTIVSADEVFQGGKSGYPHKDELWIWTAPTELAVEHLKRFLSAFQNSSQIQGKEICVEFLGENAEELELIFTESFLPCQKTSSEKHIPIAVIYYEAGLINSRKAMISPYLPSLSK